MVNQQPRPEGTGYVGSVRNGLHAGSIPDDTKYLAGKNALKGGVLNPLANKSNTLSASLYIHVPFCTSLCDYCDFYS
ncbi:MAG: hypothetical protein LBU66_04340, partial [Treponema sp.]|nr:hypothetical protein [Treponema sp.]